MRALSILVRLLLLLLAAALGALALGAFASLNPGAPTWMRTLSAAEGLLLGPLLGKAFQTGLLPSGEWRGFALAGLSALAVFLAAWPRSARAEVRPEPRFPGPGSSEPGSSEPGGAPPPGRP